MIDRHTFHMFTLFIFWSVLIFFWNIWLNDIWTANEAFYAEAVREMFENKNFIEIYYNYEPRFNKPPLTYWSIALSSLIFGLNEFAVRLPIVLYAIGSIILTFLIAMRLYKNVHIAFYSLFVVMFSVQFFINSRYASPEIPLTFFFTLTLYFFLVGYQTKRWIYIYLSYLALSLTILTKGYPYLIVIGGIVIFYLLIENQLSLKRFWKDFLFLRVHLGIPIILVIGFSWFVYMYLKFGNQFLDIYMEETIKRALTKKSKGISDLFFYIYVILWGFLPYSLVFFYSLYFSFRDKIKKHYFILSWIGVMFIIFTIAKGKIPTYFIQAHPALAILTGYAMYHYISKNKYQTYFYYLLYIVPTILILYGNYYLIHAFNLDYFYYIIMAFPILYILKYKDVRLVPYLSALVIAFTFTVSVLPIIEKYRPYDQIGTAVKENFVPKTIPLMIENRFIHNLPFYTKRKVLRDITTEKIVSLYRTRSKPILALVTQETLQKLENAPVIWKGYLYKKSSESRFLILIKYVIKAYHGDMSGFEKRFLIYRP
ncbi:MAG: glycosyltransferase family 39 protein [Aquificae bacterium]|nr:glycosyltransferase family 39 protein [Aquificota bacterium]